MFIKGVELVYHEFKELILEMAILLKDQVEHSAGKLKSLVTKFLEDHFLKRLSPFIRFSTSKDLAKVETSKNATRSWPESEKDQTIKVIMEEKARQQAEEERIREEERKKKEEEEANAKAEQDALEAQKAQEESANQAKTEKKNSEEHGASAAEDDEEDEENNEFASDFEESDY